MLIEDLNKLIQLVNVYQQKISALPSTSEEQKQLTQEVTRRLKYLIFIVEEIQKLQTQLLVRTDTDPALVKLSKEGNLSQEEMQDFWKRNPVEDMIAKFKLWDQLTFFTESFYYHAFRCGKCVEQLPGLSSFKYQGIILVRNHLIEHPEKQKHSNILSGSIRLGQDTGPVLKNSRLEWEDKIFQDNGLNHNAGEFLDNFIKLLTDFNKD